MSPWIPSQSPCRLPKCQIDYGLWTQTWSAELHPQPERPTASRKSLTRITHTHTHTSTKPNSTLNLQAKSEPSNKPLRMRVFRM